MRAPDSLRHSVAPDSAVRYTEESAGIAAKLVRCAKDPEFSASADQKTQREFAEESTN
jgi:hypothetical protein